MSAGERELPAMIPTAAELPRDWAGVVEQQREQAEAELPVLLSGPTYGHAIRRGTVRGATRIGLVGCGSAKLGRPAPARDLYTSQLFRKASAYAEATCDRWFVLSAKHGLVRPDQILEPYDVKLGANLPSSPPIHDWAAMVREQLTVELADVAGAVLVALAGEQYRTVLRPCAWPFEIPMQGLGIGQQLGFLTRELQQLEAAA